MAAPHAPAMRSRETGLWRHPEFLKLWAGQTISLFGSEVTRFALPLTAALTLQASPTQMGVLQALEFAPFLLFGLLAGAWVDRLHRRPVLIGADLGRAAVLASIPIAALLGVLRMEQLYVAGFLAGVLTVFFDVAYQAFLPTLVRRDHLVEGNSKLEVSRSVAQIAGPGLAGPLVQLVGAPLAILVDAASFLFSVAFLGMLRTPEPAPANAGRRNIWVEIGDGLRVVVGHPWLRSLAGCTATSNLFAHMLFAVYVLHLTRDLGLQPATLGLIFAFGGPASLLGALVAGRAARRFGLGRTIVAATVVPPAGALLIPLAGSVPALTVPLLIAAQALFALGTPVYNINQVSLRQAITPPSLQGRMNASMRFIVWGTIPIGSLLGGLLGEAIGLRTAIAVAALGMLLAFPWVYLSPVRTLSEQPAPVRDGGEESLAWSRNLVIRRDLR